METTEEEEEIVWIDKDLLKPQIQLGSGSGSEPKDMAQTLQNKGEGIEQLLQTPQKQKKDKPLPQKKQKIQLDLELDPDLSSSSSSNKSGNKADQFDFESMESKKSVEFVIGKDR